MLLNLYHIAAVPELNSQLSLILFLSHPNGGFVKAKVALSTIDDVQLITLACKFAVKCGRSFANPRTPNDASKSGGRALLVQPDRNK